MSDNSRRRPDPARQELLRSVFVSSPLAEVADAVSVATEHERHVYVERFDDGWRWSLAHRGSGYPLLRITARFLQVDHHRIMIGFRTLPNGWSILCEDPQHPRLPEAWAVIEFDQDTPAASVAARARALLGPEARKGNGRPGSQ